MRSGDGHGHGHGVRYLFRAQLRRRWLAWTAMGVLVGVVAGAVMAAAIGALRVDSAGDRFFAASNAFDVGVALACDTDSSACLDQVLALPGVEDGAEFRQVTQLVTTVDGELTQPTDDTCYSGPGQVLLGADPEGRFGTDVNRIRLLEGRLPDAEAAHEVVIAPEMASRLDLHPGDRLVSYPDSPDCQSDDRGNPFDLDIVGVGVAPFLVRPPTGEYFNLVIGSPALLDEVTGGGSFGVITLDAGAAGVDDFLAAAQGIEIPADGLILQAGFAENIERGLRPQAVALALVALLAGLAALTVLGSALYRQTTVDTAADRTLTVLGMTAGERLRAGGARGAVIAAVASVTAGCTAYALSSSVLTGLARLVDPQPGWRLHPVPVLVGMSLTAGVVAGIVAAGSWWSGRRALPSADHPAPSVPRLASRAAGLGWPPTAVSGIGMTLERGHGSRSVPVLSSLIGVLIGLTVLVGTITFSASLQHLEDTPRTVGWNWDFGVPMPEDDPAATADILEVLEARPEVAEHSPATFFRFLGGGLGVGPLQRSVSLFAFGPGGVGPTVLDGRAPTSPREIVLGTETLADTGLHIGDEVDLAVIDEEAVYAGPVAQRTAVFTIVGTTVLPISGAEGRLGGGVATTLAGIRRMYPEARPEVMWIRLEPGTTSTGVVAAASRAGDYDAGEAADLFGGELITDTLVDVGEVDRLPLVLAALVGAMAAGVLAHVMVTAVRARRRDLALLRTIGFTQRQVQATVGWQATLLSGFAVVVALPLGVAAGRATWTRYAESLGALPEPVVPVAWLAATAVATVGAANLVAAVPGWLASRDRPAEALRSE